MPVICLHSNASSSSQWRALMDLLSPTHLVMATDSYGSGKSPAWQSTRALTLADEVALLEPVLDRVASPVILVGHSYGAAVALKTALRFPGRVRALALYEPTFFSLIAGPPPNDADGIRIAVEAALLALEQGDRDAAAQSFIDYWMGPGSWSHTPAPRRQPIADSIVNVGNWANALHYEPTSLDELRQLRMPVLYMVGQKSPLSAIAVSRILIPALADVRSVVFEGLGHMAPVTHPQVINEEIVRFINGLAPLQSKP